MDSSEALQTYAKSKISDKVRKFVTKPIETQVTFAVDRHQHQATCLLRGGDGFNIEVTHSCDDMYGSVDRVVDKLESQLKKHKEKLKDHKQKRGSKVVPLPVEDVAPEFEDKEVDAADIVKFDKVRGTGK